MTPTVRRALAAVIGGLLIALNRKFGLDLDTAAIVGITTLVVAYIGQSWGKSIWQGSKLAVLLAVGLMASCASTRTLVAPPAPAPRNCQASWQEAKAYDTAGLTSAGAAAAVGSLIAGRELTEQQRWAAGITAGVLTTLAITFGSLKGYSERELERCQADETAQRITEALRAARPASP